MDEPTNGKAGVIIGGSFCVIGFRGSYWLCNGNRHLRNRHTHAGGVGGNPGRVGEHTLQLGTLYVCRLLTLLCWSPDNG